MPALVLDRPALRRLREALDRAEYTGDKVQAALKTDRHYTSLPGEVIVFERRLAGHSPLETLIKLFLIGSTVDEAEVDASFPDLPPGELERLGMIERTNGRVRSTLRIIPHGDVMVSCDRSYYLDEQADFADVAEGVSSPSSLLADLTVRRQVDRALDLGTGTGIQALLVAHHAKHVIAIDVNARALRYAEMSACLSGVDNIEFRQGSWFDPVQGERFDVIIANPPYVMSPDSRYLYRDSGMRADSLCRQLVRELPNYLEEGGFASILISWALKSGQDWSEPLRQWLDGLPCDVWLLHYLSDDPLAQAAKWNRPASPAELAGYGAALDRWTDYYRTEGIDQIAFGAVIMCRRSGAANWTRADSLRVGFGSSSRQIQRVFEAEDYLCGLRDHRELLDQKLTMIAEHRLEQRLASSRGIWQLQEASLSLTEGIIFQGGVDANMAQILQNLDGKRTLRQAVHMTASALKLSAADEKSLAETAVVMSRRLMQLGFLVRTT
jgi:methylase of polypeptide subunit release factors